MLDRTVTPKSNRPTQPLEGCNAGETAQPESLGLSRQQRMDKVIQPVGIGLARWLDKVGTLLT